MFSEKPAQRSDYVYRSEYRDGKIVKAQIFGEHVMSTTRDRKKGSTPDIGENPDCIPERNVVVPSVPPLMEVSLTDGGGESPEPSQTLILITEQEVLFSTSAAVSLQREKNAHWWVDATRVFIAASMRRMSRTPAGSAPPAPKYCPRRYGYLEAALMAREMDRL
jgi:hypothetical protein